MPDDIRPDLPDALPDVPDMEGVIRAQLLRDFNRMVSLIQKALRSEPDRALRWVALLGAYAGTQRKLIAELGLDDQERLHPDAGDDNVMAYGGNVGIGQGLARPLRMRQAGGHMYANNPQGPEGLLAGALAGQAQVANAQQIDAFTRVMARTCPTGPLPNAEVYATAERNMRALLGPPPAGLPDPLPPHNGGALAIAHLPIED